LIWPVTPPSVRLFVAVCSYQPLRDTHLVCLNSEFCVCPSWSWVCAASLQVMIILVASNCRFARFQELQKCRAEHPPFSRGNKLRILNVISGCFCATFLHGFRLPQLFCAGRALVSNTFNLPPVPCATRCTRCANSEQRTPPSFAPPIRPPAGDALFRHFQLACHLPF